MVDYDSTNWAMAQTITNAVLTFFLILITAYYAWQTHDQSIAMANQLMETQRDRKIDRLNREMTLLIEPLYSVFRKYPSMVEFMAYPWGRKHNVPSGQGERENDYINYTKKEDNPQKFDLLHEPEAKMVDVMRSYQYLAQSDLRHLIMTFLAFYPYGKQENFHDIYENLKGISVEIDKLVKARYDRIAYELRELESPTEKEIKKKVWWQFWKWRGLANVFRFLK